MNNNEIIKDIENCKLTKIIRMNLSLREELQEIMKAYGISNEDVMKKK